MNLDGDGNGNVVAAVRAFPYDPTTPGWPTMITAPADAATAAAVAALG